MAQLTEVVEHCDRLLEIATFKDYCPNGLQVDSGNPRVERIVSGVTASLALIDAAVELQADLLLVHHGWFWRSEAATLTGIKGRRVRKLLAGGISLLAYHLPLDAHAELGNNRLLGDRLGFNDHKVVEEGSLVWGGHLEQPLTPPELAMRIAGTLDRAPLHLPGGPQQIRRVAWCSGGAQGEIESAARLGFDAFISGEVSEYSTHLAAELGIHYFAAGHHATERYGAEALGQHLARQFGVEHHFVDIPNPV